MMKHTKRLLALVLTLTLAFGLAVPAMANTSNNVFENIRDDIRRNILARLIMSAIEEIFGRNIYRDTGCTPEDDCYWDALWRNFRPWLIWGSIAIASTLILFVITVFLIGTVLL